MATDEEWIAAMKAKGHLPRLDEHGELDVWVVEFDIHNGPGCAVCGESWCMHCTRPDQIGECDCIEGHATGQPGVVVAIRAR